MWRWLVAIALIALMVGFVAMRGGGGEHTQSGTAPVIGADGQIIQPRNDNTKIIANVSVLSNATTNLPKAAQKQ